tara:strand:+ start:513 stop:650 length:138 start_codon:yes stop_codon:yes gene_type:complete
MKKLLTVLGVSAVILTLNYLGVSFTSIVVSVVLALIVIDIAKDNI